MNNGLAETMCPDAAVSGHINLLAGSVLTAAGRSMIWYYRK